MSVVMPLLVHYDLGYIKGIRDNELFLLINSFKSYAIEMRDMCLKLKDFVNRANTHHKSYEDNTKNLVNYIEKFS